MTAKEVNLYIRRLPPIRLKEGGSIWSILQIAYDRVRLYKRKGKYGKPELIKKVNKSFGVCA